MQELLNLPNIIQKLFCDMLSWELVIDKTSCIGVATNSQLMRGSLDESRFRKDNQKNCLFSSLQDMFSFRKF